jgi:hypothetical protein
VNFSRTAPSYDLAKAINYKVGRCVAFTRFLDDGRICLSNNAAERAVRCVAVGQEKLDIISFFARQNRSCANLPRCSR